MERIDHEIDITLPYTGWNTHRLRKDGYHDQEVLLHKLANGEDMQRQWDLIVFGQTDGVGPAQPRAHLNSNDKKIIGSILQWLGTPVGESFLERAGYIRNRERVDHNNLPKWIFEVDKSNHKFKSFGELFDHAVSLAPRDHQYIIQVGPGTYPVETDLRIPDRVTIVGALVGRASSGTNTGDQTI